MESTVASTLFGISCIYTSVVVAARECRSTPCTSFTVPFFWASVAIVRRMTWKVVTAGGLLVISGLTRLIEFGIANGTAGVQ
jgi:hypothetical protein